MDARAIQHSLYTFGLGATAYDLAYRAATKVTDFMFYKGISLTMSSIDSSFLERDSGYRWGFVGRDELFRALSGDAGEDMDEAFINEALARGDRCYGAFDGDTLASYGWCSTRETPINEDLVLRFNPAYAYRYKGYTLPAYRGRRLHGVGMARSLEVHAAEGLKGLVCYVKANNFPSLRSCYRTGYRDFGWIVVVKVGGRYWIHASEGCKAFDFCVAPVSEARLLATASPLSL